MRVMAIDYGDAHTGIAISDAMGMITGFATTIHTRREETLLTELEKIISAHAVTEIVLGLPRNMDGSEGPRAALCRQFGETICAHFDITPTLWDERRTSIDAHRILFQSGKNGKKQKKTVDAVAASLILEGYLSFRTNRSAAD